MIPLPWSRGSCQSLALPPDSVEFLGAERRNVHHVAPQRIPFLIDSFVNLTEAVIHDFQPNSTFAVVLEKLLISVVDFAVWSATRSLVDHFMQASIPHGQDQLPLGDGILSHGGADDFRSEEHTSELQSLRHL